MAKSGIEISTQLSGTQLNGDLSRSLAIRPKLLQSTLWVKKTVPLLFLL